MMARKALPYSRWSYSPWISGATLRRRLRKASSLVAQSVATRPSNFFVMKPAARLAILMYLPIRSLLTRAMKSSEVKSMSSTFELSLAAM
ncbi:hypothetical protein D3C81_1604990 [compost metagenome]